MNKSNISENIQKVISDIDNKNFKEVLVKMEYLLKNYPDLNILNWENEIKIYEKVLNIKLEKYKIFVNIGVLLFKFGKINDSILAFKKSIDSNPNFSLAYNNLAVSFLELGMFQEASYNFALALKFNKNNLSAQNHLINMFNLASPINHEENKLVNLNFEIKNLINNLNITNYHLTENIKILLRECKNLILKTEENITFNETQILGKIQKT